MVAPNSPSDRAKESTAPDTSPGSTSGSVIRRNTVVGPAPSEAATTSYRWPAVRSAPSSDTTRNGIATKVCAITTAIVENAIWIPSASSVRAEQAAPAEGVEQGQTADHRRQHERQQDQRAQHAQPREVAPGQHQRHRHAEHHAQQRCSPSTSQAQPERRRESLGGDQRAEVRPVDPGDDRDQREQHEGRPDERRDVDPPGQPDGLLAVGRLRRRVRAGRSRPPPGWPARCRRARARRTPGPGRRARSPSAPRSGRCSRCRWTRGTVRRSPRRRPRSRR